jgi:hypothetical protein
MVLMADSRLELRGGDWLEALPARVSRRRFDGRPADAETLSSFDEHCRSFCPYDEARVVLLRDVPAGLFTGIVGGYGKITGSPHALVVIARGSSVSSEWRAGYTGEAAILEAAVLGLDTCWVAGFFSPRTAAAAVSLESDERIVAVSPLGFAQPTKSAGEGMMRRMANADRRKPLAVIAPGIGEEWPDWAHRAVEAARIAPSAMNRQPWRFRTEDGALIVARDSAAEVPKVTKALDCGIAALHAELAARAAGAPGSWTDVERGLDVAEYRPETLT